VQAINHSNHDPAFEAGSFAKLARSAYATSLAAFADGAASCVRKPGVQYCRINKLTLYYYCDNVGRTQPAGMSWAEQDCVQQSMTARGPASCLCQMIRQLLHKVPYISTALLLLMP
jgi:hypothetical protein